MISAYMFPSDFIEKAISANPSSEISELLQKKTRRFTVKKISVEESVLKLQFSGPISDKRVQGIQCTLSFLIDTATAYSKVLDCR